MQVHYIIHFIYLETEIRGSDSGISLHSRDDNISRTLFEPADAKSSSRELCLEGDSNPLPQCLKDLPFDMPKLRRRRNVIREVISKYRNIK